MICETASCYQGKLKRGRGTLKQPIFGVFEQDAGVYTENSARL